MRNAAKTVEMPRDAYGIPKGAKGAIVMERAAKVFRGRTVPAVVCVEFPLDGRTLIITLPAATFA